MINKKIYQERFENSIEMIPECGCWIWTKTCFKTGYGFFRMGDIISAHRASWFLFRGPIPNGLHVLHRCDTRSCVNPNHLFLGTNSDNVQDCLAKKRHAFVLPMLRGEDHGACKLSKKQVIEIRNSSKSLSNLSSQYDISMSQVWRIKRKLSWSHL